MRNEPHSYDLCDRHAHGLSAPQGWSMLRIQDHDLPDVGEPSKGTLFGL